MPVVKEIAQKTGSKGVGTRHASPVVSEIAGISLLGSN
jgi:hypothetical protein